MRLLISCISLSSALMLTNVAAIAARNTDNGVKIIHGLNNAKHFKGQSKGEYYIQAGSFKFAKNADKYKAHLIEKFHHPVIVKTKGAYHVVLIGPLHSAAEVRSLNSAGGKVVPVTEEVSQPVLKQHRHKYQEVTSTEYTEVALIESPSHFDVIGAVGVANLMAGDGFMGVTTSETDTLIQTNSNDWNNFTGQLGLGYNYYFPGKQLYSENLQWFPSIEPEVNGYYIARSNINGDVWRFGSPAFNDMTYTMSVESSRLMFDTALTIASKRQYSLYAIGGIGAAWNRIGYSDAERNGIPCLIQALNLNTTTFSNFSWEAGAGLSYAFNNRFSLSLEYLYTDLGTVNTPATGSTGTITMPVIVPASFKLTSQAALFGLHVAI